MRSDMPKLLVERCRGGWRGRKSRPCLQSVRELDSLPIRVSIARDVRKTKWLSENLAPLARLLERRVGQPWDRVYSEIRAHVRFDDPIQLHVLQHLWQFVERDVVMIEGWPHRSNGQRLIGWRRSFYVCPSTGLLLRVPPEPRKRWRWDGSQAPERKRRRRGKRNGSRR